MLTKYGYNTIGFTVILVFILIGIGILTGNSAVKYTLIIIGSAFMLFTLYFFRDPDRTAPDNEQAIVSPADGKVIIIEEADEDKFLNESATKLSIFMSPLNVHVNRIPIDGTVDYLKYVKGEYLVAFHEKADERNERTEIGITSKNGKVLFTQVAGYVARRVICNLNNGDSVKQGERFGMIKFGSRSDVYASEKWELKVKKGDKVTAGETVLFKLKEE